MKTLLSLAALVMLTGMGGPAKAQSTLSGEPGRVIILDASGSMRKNTYDSLGMSRMDMAKEVFGELVDRYSRGVAPLPTSVHVFGARQSWDAVASRYGNDPGRYETGGPLCRDYEQISPFSRYDRSLATSIKARVGQIDWNGMTPIHLAILDAMRTLDPVHGGEIVIISDFAEPNCLEPGQTICDALLPVLQKFDSAGAPVRFKVAELPSVDLAAALAPCAATITVPLPPSDPDIEAAADALTEELPVRTAFRIDVPSALDPEGVDPTPLTYNAYVGNPEKRLATGFMRNGIAMPRGQYRFEFSDRGGPAFSATATLTPRQAGLVVNSPPALLSLSAERAGSAVPRLDRLRIIRDDAAGTVVLDTTDIRLPIDLPLANRRYRVEGFIGAESAAIDTAAMQLGVKSAGKLSFDALATARDVTIAVEIERPTLDTGAWTPPSVSLMYPQGQTTALDSGTVALTLEPGRYKVIVQGNTRHELDIAVAPGPDPLALDVRIPAGRIKASASGTGGVFSLEDSGGAILYHFTDPEIFHSLPDGNYTLIYELDGKATARRAFSISLGETTVLGAF